MLYLYIFENVFEKGREHLWRGLSYESCGIADHSLLQVKFNTDILLVIWWKCWLNHQKIKKLSRRNEGISAFQTIAVHLYKQPKTTTKKKEHTRLVIFSIEIDVVARSDDEIYVLSTIKIYSYFSFVFSVVAKKFELLKISKVMQLFWKLLPPCKNRR